MTTEAGSTGLAGRLVDTASETGRVFDPPRFLRLPPGVAVVGPAVWKSVVLARPRLQQLFSAVGVIAHIPGRAVIPCGIASVSGKPPPSPGNRDEAEIAPLVGGVVAAALLQGFLVDASTPTIEKVFAMLFRAGGALDALALLGVALRLGVGATAAVDSLDVLFRHCRGSRERSGCRRGRPWPKPPPR